MVPKQARVRVIRMTRLWPHLQWHCNTMSENLTPCATLTVLSDPLGHVCACLGTLDFGSIHWQQFRVLPYIYVAPGFIAYVYEVISGLNCKELVQLVMDAVSLPLFFCQCRLTVDFPYVFLSWSLLVLARLGLCSGLFSISPPYIFSIPIEPQRRVSIGRLI
ncbi:hypothetical protein F4819DRAFT_116522 [Hypoxylon fuscum]|nr:hypothetical protein F4819DRAFT_116522 [Hypoxylon fuscum]